MDNFNKNLEQLIYNLKKFLPDVDSENYYNFSEPGDTYIVEFYNNCEGLANDIANKNEILFSDENIILTHIDFNKIWNLEELNDENRSVIWNYLQTLYLFALEYNQSLDLKKILKNIKNIHADDESLSDTMRNLVNIVNSLTNKESVESIRHAAASVESTDSDTKDKKNVDFELPEIFDGTIGDLAKEIMEDLDPSTLNLDNPVELLSSLMTGNLDENSDSGIMNLIKSVTGKIENKISSGSLNEAQLLSEAQNMMGSLTKMTSNDEGSEGGEGGMGNLLDTMLSSLQGGGTGDGDMGGMGEMLKSMMSGLNSSSKKATMDNIQKKKDKFQNKQRLRNKLEEKKQLLREQESLLDQELDKLAVPEIDERDLDALVHEIENTGSIGKKKKKKKKKKKNLHEISQEL